MSGRILLHPACLSIPMICEFTHNHVYIYIQLFWMIRKNLLMEITIFGGITLESSFDNRECYLQEYESFSFSEYRIIISFDSHFKGQKSVETWPFTNLVSLIFLHKNQGFDSSTIIDGSLNAHCLPTKCDVINKPSSESILNGVTIEFPYEQSLFANIEIDNENRPKIILDILEAPNFLVKSLYSVIK